VNTLPRFQARKVQHLVLESEDVDLLEFDSATILGKHLGILDMDNLKSLNIISKPNQKVKICRHQKLVDLGTVPNG
jgi:hypothetical protein